MSRVLANASMILRYESSIHRSISLNDLHMREMEFIDKMKFEDEIEFEEITNTKITF